MVPLPTRSDDCGDRQRDGALNVSRQHSESRSRRTHRQRDHVFGLWVNQGFEDADHNLPHLWQGGLGLPDRDNYLDTSAAGVELRAKYEAHIAAVLKLAGFADAETRAPRVLSLETKIAAAFAPDSDAADVFKQNNPWKRRDFDAKAPGMDWDAYFNSAGLAKQVDFIVWQPSAFSGVSALVANASIGEWQDYLRFHLVEHYATVLTSADPAEHFAFYGTTLAGTKQPPDRIEAAIDATNGALGQAVGQLYVQRYFPPEARTKAQAMVRDLTTAYRARISNLSWMSPQTKEKALAKLSALEIGVGYPGTWIDYSTLDVVPGDALGNMRRAEAFYHQRDIARLGQPIIRLSGRSMFKCPARSSCSVRMRSIFPRESCSRPTLTARVIPRPPTVQPAPPWPMRSVTASTSWAISTTPVAGLACGGPMTIVRGIRRRARKLAVQLSAYCPQADLCVNGKQVLGESLPIWRDCSSHTMPMSCH